MKPSTAARAETPRGHALPAETYPLWHLSIYSIDRARKPLATAIDEERFSCLYGMHAVFCHELSEDKLMDHVGLNVI